MSRTSGNNIRDLLQRWLSGDTKRQEEEQLESLAREDAFLAEAMEGYRQFPEGKHEERLSRIRARVQEQSKEKRPLIFYLSRAAAVLVFIVIAGVGINRFFTESPASLGQEMSVKPIESIAEKDVQVKEFTQVAPVPENQTTPLLEEAEKKKSVPTDREPTTIDNSSASARKKTEQKKELPSQPPSSPASAPSVANAAPANTAPTKEIDQPVNMRGSRTESTEYYVDGIAIQSDLAEDSIAPIAAATVDESSAYLEDQVISAADEPAVTTDVIEEADIAYQRAQQKADDQNRDGVSRAKKTNHQRQIQGLVKDAATGDPLPFVTILIPETTEGTVTDIDGKFSLNVASSTQQLAVSYTGYNKQVVDISKNNQVDVFLDDDGVVLSEVVITGYDQKAKTKKVEAKPKKGFKKYQKYINQSRIYPEAAKAAGITGKVIIEFIVGPEGRPTQLKVKQSLGYGCDEEALRLIREGADWKGIGVPTQYTISFGE